MPVARSAVVLVFDRLPAAMLGPYGGTWCDTPACNRLAAEGFLAEQCWSDSGDLEVIYRSYWSGWHAAAHRRLDRNLQIAGMTSGPSLLDVPLAQRLAAAGLYTELITDDAIVANHRWAESFDDRLVFPHEGPATTAENAGSMRVAQLLAAAAERLDSVTRPTLLWIHASAWNDAWDAPLAFRREWADEEDPEPPEFVLPPSKQFHGRCDPDELLGYLQAYVGQLAAWDACLEAWHEAFLSSPLADDSLLLVTSPRGYPLGEHGVVGDAASRFYSELLHVPLFLRLPQTPFPLIRDQTLVQPADVYPTLVEWCCGQADEPPALETETLETETLETETLATEVEGELATELDNKLDTASRRLREWRGQNFLGRAMIADESADKPSREFAAALGDRQIAVLSKSWFLRIESSESDSTGTGEETSAETRELFARPDDRWEANEIGARCPEPLEELTGIARKRYGWGGESV